MPDLYLIIIYHHSWYNTNTNKIYKILSLLGLLLYLPYSFAAKAGIKSCSLLVFVM